MAHLAPETVAARGRVLKERNDVVERYHAGASVNAIARDYGVRPEWLRDRFSDWNVPMRTRSQAAIAWWRQRPAEERRRARRRGR